MTKKISIEVHDTVAPPFVGATVVVKIKNNNRSWGKQQDNEMFFLVPAIVTEIYDDGMTIEGVAVTTNPAKNGLGSAFSAITDVKQGDNFGEWTWPVSKG